MSSTNLTRVWRRLPILLVPALLAFAIGKAQGQQAPATLTLEQAIRLAKQNNPVYRMQANNAAVADWNVAESMAQLVPSFGVSTGFRYQPAGKPQVIGSFTAADLGISETPPYYSSDYSLGASLNLSGQTFFQIAQSKADRASTLATISAAEYNLTNDVTRDYLAALRAKESIDLAKKELASATESHKLAAARFEVGEGTKIDVAGAEVTVGRAEVALVIAQNLYETSKLQLLQRMGVSLDSEFDLTTTFQVFEPTWSKEELVALALKSHPQIAAARAAESASTAATRAAKTAYLPSLSLNAGWGGFAREVGSSESVLSSTKSRIESQFSGCVQNNRLRALLGDTAQNCARFTYTDEMGRQALEANDVFPFNWSSNTPSFSARISIPVFNNLSRERQMQQARAAENDAKHQRRQVELQQQTQVATAHLNLRTAYRTVALEKRNAETATTQLELARERYRLGAGTFVDLSNAEAVKARADRDYISAVYAFHENLAALEAAVGQPLRR